MEQTTSRKSPLFIRALTVRQSLDTPTDGRVEMRLENMRSTPFANSMIVISFYDYEGRIRDRVNISLPPFAPGEIRNVSSFIRLKNSNFFTYTVKLRLAGQ